MVDVITATKPGCWSFTCDFILLDFYCLFLKHEIIQQVNMYYRM